jgi:DNA-3-methyladenine glycosylase
MVNENMLPIDFFNQDTIKVARKLLGKVIRVKYRRIWLCAMIVETEAYYLDDKASHASLGYTAKRKALFMPPGTIYMYYARGGDSLNVSCKGEGDAVLIKAGIPYLADAAPNMIQTMQRLNPVKNSGRIRPPESLCSGQALLCNSLNLKVKKWDGKQFDSARFYIEDVSYKPTKIIQTKRLGISKGRDEHLEYRFVDSKYVKFSSKRTTSISKVITLM